MGYRPANDPFNGVEPVADKLIGNAYDTVRTVATNIATVKHVSANLEILNSVHVALDDIALVADALETLDGVSVVAAAAAASATASAVSAAAAAAAVATPSAFSVTATGTTTARTLADHTGDITNVRNFGALGDGTTQTTQFQAAYDAAAAGSTILVPPGAYTVGSLTGSKVIYWDIRADTNVSATLLNLPGMTGSQHGSSRMLRKGSSTGADYAVQRIDRNANHTGGTPYFVCNTLRVNTTVGAGVTNFEWGLVSLMDNSANAGENVATYSRCVKRSTLGPSWAGVFEMHDTTTAPTTAAVSMEVDVFANGADTNSKRFGIDIVAGKADSGGTTCEAYCGVRIGPQFGSSANGVWHTGFLVTDDYTTGMRLEGTNTTGVQIVAASATAAIDLGGSGAVGLLSSGTYTTGVQIDGTATTGLRVSATASSSGINVSGTTPVGLLLSSGTFSAAAIRLARAQKISWEATDTIATALGAADSVVKFSHTGNERVGLECGSSAANASIRINATKVIGPRATGWAAASGTATRTTFSTATVTTAQLAERVKGLLDDLISHGLIGA